MTLNLEKITGTFEVKGHKPINYEYYIKSRTMVFGNGSEKLTNDEKNKLFYSIQQATEETPEKIVSYE